MALNSALVRMPPAIFQQLIGEDIDLYQVVLESDGMTEYHLSPLIGKPTQFWSTKAKLALDAGYNIDAIVHATLASP